MTDCYYIKIKNLNVQKIINNLIKKFDIYNIEEQQQYITFCFKKQGLRQIKNYLINNGVEILEIKKIGRFSNFFTVEKVGIFIGFAICMVLWIISTFFVTKIVVYGNNLYTLQDITNIVNDFYSSAIIPKYKINTDDIEKTIISNTSINTVSCVIKGNCLIINIKEELRNNTYVEGEFFPIISIYDGQVVSINLTQGTPAVSVGQIIKLGDVLVYPYVIDSNGEKRYMQPIADIVCDVWITTKLDVYDTQEIKYKTGAKQQVQNIYAFGKQVYSSNTQIKFNEYEKSTKTNYLTNFIMPIKIETITYEETKKIIQSIDFEKEKQKYINKCRQIAFLGVKEYDIIKDETQTISSNNGINTITYVITVRKKVC